MAREDLSNKTVLKSAGVMGVAVFLSRILGLVREQVFAALFGASHATDAYQIAFRIPNLLRDLFAEGAMSAALVPTFINEQKQGGLDRGWQIATRVFVVLFLVVFALSCVGILFAEHIVHFYAEAYRQVPGKFELTVRMTQIMMPFFPLVAIAAGFMAILNACGIFFMPSFASALFNLVSIVVGVVCSKFLPAYGVDPIEGMAYGVVAGGAIQACAQWPVLRKVGYRVLWKGPLSKPLLQDPGLKKMMLLMIPGTLGLAATQINILVNSIFATSVGEGAVSWLNYAFRLMQFPIGIFGVSIASATLPAFSRHFTNKNSGEAEMVLIKSLRQVFAINFPAAVGLACLAEPIIGLIFEHGYFEHSDTLATSRALQAYALGLVAYSVVKVLVPICYAIGKTKVAVLSSLFSVMSNLGFNYLFVSKLGFVGLALGTSLTAILNSLLLWYFVRTQRGASLIKPLMLYLFAAAIMGMIVYMSDQAVSGVLPGSSVPKFAMRVGIGVLLGVGTYLGVSILFKLEESLEILSLFKRRLGRGRS